MEKEVAIYSVPLEAIKKERLQELRDMLLDDKSLNKVITEYSVELAKEDIETWEIDRNLIITEAGYKMALFAEEENDGK